MKKVLVQFLACFIYCNLVVGQSYNFDVYSLEEGLQQSQVTGLAEDTLGRLWVSTLAGGISIFDGKNFEVITAHDNLYRRVDNMISSSDGTIYILADGGSKVFEIKNFEPNNITAIQSEINGFITILTHENTLYMIAHNGGLYKYRNGKVSLVLENATQIGFDEKGALYSLAKEKLFFIDNQRVIEKKRLNEISKYTGSSKFAIYEGWLWFNNKNGIGRLCLDEGIIQILGAKEGFVDAEARSVAIIDDELIITTEGHGFAVYKEGKFNFYRQNNIQNKNLFKGVFKDSKGRIWVQGDGSGLLLFKGKDFVHYDQSDGMLVGETWAIESFGKGVLIGTFGGGIYQVGEDLKIKNVSDKFGIKSNEVVHKIKVIDENTILLGTYSGLYLHKYGKNIELTASLPFEDKTISHIYAESATLFYFIVDGKYLMKYDNGKIHQIASNKEEKAIRFNLIEKYQDKLLLGCTDDLFELDEKTEKLTRITDKISGNQVPGYITTIVEDKYGNLVLGSNNGLIFSKPDGTVKVLKQKDGLISNTVFFCYLDENNEYWIGHEKGVQRLKINEKIQVEHVQLYDGNDGLRGVETNLHAVTKDSLGNYWFGTLEGVSAFNPGMEVRNETPPMVYLKEVKMFYQSVDWKLKKFAQNKMGIPVNLKLPYNENNLSFVVHGINLFEPISVKYQFKLDGADEDWLPITSTNEITYSNLSPGNYSLLVRASNENQVWSEEIKYSFEITPPFWQLGWFKVMILIIITSLTVVTVKYRERRLQQEKDLLQLKVRERTREILEQKEMILNQKGEIEKKSSQITESIEYAKKIQNNILPNHNVFKDTFSDFFVLYKPKDIVSGDFYWSHQVGDWTYVASVDCTGHGVPGALMSIIGHNLLELVYAENKSDDISTARMLRGVKEKMQDFKDDAYDGNKLRDGMTISLMAFNKSTNELKFSGSYTGIYLIQDGNLTELKGDKIPIGDSITILDSKTFKEERVQLKKGDKIYLSSDGFPDQVGGEKRKKFYYEPFRNLLKETASMSSREQRDALWSSFMEWKGNHEQYDDVMVIGLTV